MRRRVSTRTVDLWLRRSGYFQVDQDYPEQALVTAPYRKVEVTATGFNVGSGWPRPFWRLTARAANRGSMAGWLPFRPSGEAP